MSNRLERGKTIGLESVCTAADGGITFLFDRDLVSSTTTKTEHLGRGELELAEHNIGSLKSAGTEWPVVSRVFMASLIVEPS